VCDPRRNASLHAREEQIGPLIALANTPERELSLGAQLRQFRRRPMKRSFKALLAVALVVTPLLTSCSEARDPIGASPTVEPQAGLISDLLGGVLKLVNVVLKGPDANGESVSAWIGPQGGTIKTAAYTLTIPANAVSKSTRFDLAPVNDGTYTVDLRAYQQGLLGLIDVGGKGFQKPVLLTFSYKNALGVENPSKLVILWVRPDGKIEVQNCDVDKASEKITGSLDHFSKYALAQN
jgi:hypothetical protein